MKLTLKSGQIVLLDDADASLLNDYWWYTRRSRVKNEDVFYALGKFKCNRDKAIFMHRLFMNPPVGMFVDHINRNGLDNRRSNLRICTAQQNQWNSKPRGRLGIKGVTWSDGCFQAGIRVNGKQLYLGRFKAAEMAAEAYRVASLKYFGEFAYLATPKGD